MCCRSMESLFGGRGELGTEGLVNRATHSFTETQGLCFDDFWLVSCFICNVFGGFTVTQGLWCCVFLSCKLFSCHGLNGVTVPQLGKKALCFD